MYGDSCFSYRAARAVACRTKQHGNTRDRAAWSCCRAACYTWRAMQTDMQVITSTRPHDIVRQEPLLSLTSINKSPFSFFCSAVQACDKHIALALDALLSSDTLRAAALPSDQPLDWSPSPADGEPASPVCRRFLRACSLATRLLSKNLDKAGMPSLLAALRLLPHLLAFAAAQAQAHAAAGAPAGAAPAAAALLDAPAGRAGAQALPKRARALLQAATEAGDAQVAKRAQWLLGRATEMDPLAAAGGAAGGATVADEA